MPALLCYYDNVTAYHHSLINLFFDDFFNWKVVVK